MNTRRYASLHVLVIGLFRGVNELLRLDYENTEVRVVARLGNRFSRGAHSQRTRGGAPHLV